VFSLSLSLSLSLFLPHAVRQTCTGDCHARFLLAWEEGVMLGDTGWSTDFEKVRVCG